MIKKNVAQATRIAKRLRPRFINNCRFPIANCQLRNQQLAIGNQKCFQCLPNIGNSIAGIICNDDGAVEAVAGAPPKLKSAFAEPLAVTVTSMVFSAAPPSRHATTVYLPGGTPLISYAPVSLLTSNIGCFNTPM